MSEKALLQQTLTNRPETDHQAITIPPDHFSSSNAPAISASVPNTDASGSNPNIEALTQLDLTLLNEPSDSSLPTGPQGPPELIQAAANNDATYHLRYLSGSIVGPSPPAYRPNND